MWAGRSTWIIVPPVALGNAVVAGVLFFVYWPDAGISPWICEQG